MVKWKPREWIIVIEEGLHLLYDISYKSYEDCKKDYPHDKVIRIKEVVE